MDQEAHAAQAEREQGAQDHAAVGRADQGAAQDKDAELKRIFTPVAAELTANEEKIVGEFAAVQGKPTDVGGYYHPDDTKAFAALRPSTTFNGILAAV